MRAPPLKTTQSHSGYLNGDSEDVLGRLDVPILIQRPVFIRPQYEHRDLWSETPKMRSAAFDKGKQIAYVAVSCVFMQPSMIPLPTTKSSMSRGSSWSQFTSRCPPSVTPRMRDPPRKHTRWSCFGTTCHVLRAVESGTGDRDKTHCSPVLGCRAGVSSWVNMIPDFLVFPMRCFLIPPMASSYI